MKATAFLTSCSLLHLRAALAVARPQPSELSQKGEASVKMPIRKATECGRRQPGMPGSPFLARQVTLGPWPHSCETGNPLISIIEQCAVAVRQTSRVNKISMKILHNF